MSEQVQFSPLQKNFGKIRQRKGKNSDGGNSVLEGNACKETELKE